MTIITDTLRQIIKAANLNDISGSWPTNDAEGRAIFSYYADFTRLWGIASKDALQGIANELCRTKNKHSIIIVWDSIPKGNTGAVNTSRYLTPIDWAVALSLNIRRVAERFHKDKEGDIELPAIKIMILDLGSHFVSEADAVKALRYLNLDMPWIELFRPDSNGGLDVFVDEIIGKRTDTPFMNNACTSMDFIEHLWQMALTRTSEPGYHHALANLMGPLLLAKDVNSDIPVTALSHLMKAIGILPTEENDKSLLTPDNPWIIWNEEYLDDFLGEGNKLNLLIVDDQYKQGWGKVLCMATGVKHLSPDVATDNLQQISDPTGRVVVSAASSPDWILDMLKGDMRFSLGLADQNDDGINPEILFLDLRLFSGKFIEEVAFFKKLIPIAKNLSIEANKENNKPPLPWPGFSRVGEIDPLEQWLNKVDKKQEDSFYISALTLLPRILALTDFSLPIVIFSSTGRRDILEKLKSYGNIITVFDKPKATADLDIAEQVKNKFQESLKKAFRILTGRKICKAIQISQNVVFHGQLVPNRTAVDEFSHIEIYIDENGSSGSQSFSVGGLVFAYPDYDAVSNLGNELIKNGIYWHRINRSDKKFLTKRPHVHNKSQYIGNTNWEYSQVLEACQKICNKEKISVMAVRVTERLNNPATNCHFPLNNVAAEEQYRRLLLHLIELTLFELFPSWARRKGIQVTISIFAGTRTPPLALISTKGNETPTDYFGYNPFPHEAGRYYTISSDSIVSLVANVLTARDDLPTDFVIHHSRGIVLEYGRSFKWPGTRVQHYLADHAVGQANNAIFNDKYLYGFDINLDDNFSLLDNANKMLLNDDLASAIYFASMSKVDNKILGHLLSKVITAMKEMKGIVFEEICEKYANPDLPFHEMTPATPQSYDNREIITVTERVERKGGVERVGREIPKKLICEKSDGTIVNVTGQWIKQMPACGINMKVGDKLSVTLKEDSGQLLVISAKLL